MDEVLKRDQNRVTVLAGVTDDSNQYVTMLRVDPTTKRLLVSATGSGQGSVTSVSGVDTNGFAFSIANPTTTPAITLSTTVTGLLKGNGTAMSAASDGTDYLSPTTGLKLNQTSQQTITNNSPIFGILTASQIVATDANKALQTLATATYPSLTELSYVKGVTSAIQTQLNAKGTGTVTAVSIATANGVSGSSSGGATPALTITLGAITPSTVNGLTISTSTGTLTVPNGVALTGPASSGTAATLGNAETFSGAKTFTKTIQTVTAMAAQALDGSLGNVFTRTLAASETFTQSNFSTGQCFMVEVKQGSGTSYTVTWFSGITWVTSGSTAPTQTTVSNGYTTYGFRCTGSNTFLGYLVGTN